MDSITQFLLGVGGTSIVVSVATISTRLVTISRTLEESLKRLANTQEEAHR
jgi:hypothetical protein